MVDRILLNWIKWRRNKKIASNRVPVRGNSEIFFKNVSFKKGDNCILRNLTIILNEGRIGIIGNNGSGKSSLIRMINGLNIPSDGEVIVFGYDTVTHTNILPQKVGFIFQNPDHQIIFPTVLEELMFGLEQQGHKPDDAKQRSWRFLQRNNCESLANLPVHTLSEGQKQLICILSILIMRPQLLILDEPFSSIDLPTRQRLMALIKNLAPRLIMVSHDLQIFTDFDRLIWLHKGEIEMDGKPETVITAYKQFATKEAVRLSEWN